MTASHVQMIAAGGHTFSDNFIYKIQFAGASHFYISLNTVCYNLYSQSIVESGCRERDPSHHAFDLFRK